MRIFLSSLFGRGPTTFLTDGERTWFFREYIFVASLEPLRVFRRYGEVKICSEPYWKRDSEDEGERERATKCHTLNQMSHPSYGKPGGFTRDDLLQPLTPDSPIGREVAEGTDIAVRTLFKALTPHFKSHENGDYTVGFYAIDGMQNELGQVKLLEINTLPRTLLVEELLATEELSRLALTSLYQFGMNDERYDVDACAEMFPNIEKVEMY